MPAPTSAVLPLDTVRTALRQASQAEDVLRSALMARAPSLAALRNALEHGASPNGKVPGAQSWHSSVSLLHLALQNGHEEGCRLLLEYGADPETESEVSPSNLCREFLRPLMHAALLDQEKSVLSLLSAGADANARTSKGWTALSCALVSGSDRALDALLRHPLADVRATPYVHPSTTKWETPTRCAAGDLRGSCLFFARTPHAVSVLLEHGLDPREKVRVRGSGSPFDRSARLRGDTCFSGSVADVLMCWGDYPLVLQALIEAGCPISARTLCQAARYVRKESLQILDDQGVSWVRAPGKNADNARSVLLEAVHHHPEWDWATNLGDRWEGVFAARGRGSDLKKVLPRSRVRPSATSPTRL